MMKRKQIRRSKPVAFTLVELMVAMTITLLLMAGLAKSFTVIGESMKKGRSLVSLSSKLRGISFRLRSDLRSRTVDVTPPITSQAGQGYFMYYEGPLTEHTFGTYGASPERSLDDGTVVYPYSPKDSATADASYNSRQAGRTYRRHSRFGDFDDYIAFTAEAPGDEWFTGKVPAYLVDDSAADPMQPTVIRSKFAEIIMWASPRWEVDANALVLADHPSAMPMYRDNNRDLVPDNVVLHQRILLIRPDLNAQRVVPLPGNQAFVSDVLRPQGGSADPYAVPTELLNLYPIGMPNPATTVPNNSYYPAYANNGSNNDNRLMLQSNWLVGMAPLHHFFDISLRRIVHPRTGEPTGFVAANSLQDLVQPHNRFAHVRYPGRYMGGNDGSAVPDNRGGFGGGASNDHVTSMPLLALGWNDAIIRWQQTSDVNSISVGGQPRYIPDPRRDAVNNTGNAQPGWFPNGHPSPLTRNTAATSAFGDDSQCGLFNGWLLPHFELGDPNPVSTINPPPGDQWKRGYLTTADARWDRTGEDVIGTNILAFDLKGFDRTAPVFVTSGRDGAPGNLGVDDDGLGGTDASFLNTLTGVVWSELGTVGTDDETISVSDLGAYQIMDQPILHPTIPSTYGADNHMLAARGAFVDLLYPYLAGSPLQERTAETGLASTPVKTLPMNAQVQTNYNAFMQSDLSLFPIPTPAATNPLNSLKRSGKLVHFGGGGNICFMQPTYDTWTDGYESDGFDQTHTHNALSPAAQGSLVGTTWVMNNITTLGQVPRIGNQPGVNVDSGRLIDSDPETSPPFATELPAISIEVRVIDPQTQEMTQFTVVESLQ